MTTIKTSWILGSPIAHRGLHNFDYPENSIPAFQNAVDHGLPIELDVHIIDDKTVIVFHDNKLSRMTNKDGYVSNLKASDLSEIKLLKTDYGIPTLEQVLQTVNGKVPLLIELKKFEQSYALEDAIIDMLKSYNGEYAVQSFDPFSMEYFYNNAPQILRGQLACFNYGNSWREKSRNKKLKYNVISHPDFISYDITHLPNKYVKNAGLPVLGWTVCGELQAQKAREVCDNIIFEGFVPKLDGTTQD